MQQIWERNTSLGFAGGKRTTFVRWLPPVFASHNDYDCHYFYYRCNHRHQQQHSGFGFLGANGAFPCPYTYRPLGWLVLGLGWG